MEQYSTLDSASLYLNNHNDREKLVDVSVAQNSTTIEMKAGKNAMDKSMNERLCFPGQNVEQNSGQPVSRIVWLETCNAILHDKLILAEREITILKQELARVNV